jgi:hypothetical protein
MTTLTGSHATALGELLGAGLADGLSGIFGQMDWAEDEIEKARKRYPLRADLIHHSFALLTPSHDLMSTEMVYRSHCTELLDRVAAGTDARPGTAAEVCAACCDASQLAPLTTSATGLYVRMWELAFPGHPVFRGQREHYEALRGSQISDLESEARRKLARPDRRLGVISCQGTHHGQPVTCTAGTVSRRPAA